MSTCFVSFCVNFAAAFHHFDKGPQVDFDQLVQSVYAPLTAVAYRKCIHQVAFSRRRHDGRPALCSTPEFLLQGHETNPLDESLCGFSVTFRDVHLHVSF